MVWPFGFKFVMENRVGALEKLASDQGEKLTDVMWHCPHQGQYARDETDQRIDFGVHVEQEKGNPHRKKGEFHSVLERKDQHFRAETYAVQDIEWRGGPHLT